MTHPLSFKLQAKKSHIDIFILGDIGLSFFGDGVDASNIIKVLAANKSAKTITVEINSGGGSAFDGIAIYNALRQHSATVTVNIIGIAASAASIVAMSGDVINIATGGMVMIHNVRSGAGGTASELREQAAMQEKMDGQMAAIYMDRNGLSKDKTLALMEAETWFTAEEAVEAGMADNIVGVADVAASIDLSAYGYTNAPTSLVASAPTVGALPAPPPKTTAPTKAHGEAKMTEILAQAAGLKADATDAKIVATVTTLRQEAAMAGELQAKLSKLTAAIGEEGDAALGKVSALLAAAEQLEANTAELAAIKESAEKARHAELVAQGKAAGQLTADLEVWVADMSSGQLEGYLKAAPKVVPLNAAVKSAPPISGGYDGKPFGELSGNELSAFKAADPERFHAMYEAHMDTLAS